MNEVYRHYVEYCLRIGVKPSTKERYEYDLRVVPSHEGK